MAQYGGMSMYLKPDNIRPWEKILIAKEKTFFYNDTSSQTHRGAFIIENDPFCVIKSSGNWIFGEYAGKESTSKGWLKKNSFYSIPVLAKK